RPVSTVARFSPAMTAVGDCRLARLRTMPAAVLPPPVVVTRTRRNPCQCRIIDPTRSGAPTGMLRSQELVWLLAAVAKGDRAAFERLYAATRAKLYGVVLRILRRHDLADEVMQETYVKIWSSAGQFDPALSSPITWMVAIARNRAID